jgi:hypothetical protein
MTACDRFEEEGLLRLEQGLDLDAHFAGCPDCLAARQAYERLQAEVRLLDGDEAPAEGWEGGVWRRIHNQPAARPPLPRWWLALPAAACLALAVFLLRPPPAGRGLELAVHTEHATGEARRGGDPRPGDSISIQATLPPARHAEVRVYRNESQAVCEAQARHDSPRPVVLQLTCRLEAAGSYQVLALEADQPLPATVGSPDRDAGAALAMGGQVKLGPDIHVH